MNLRLLDTNIWIALARGESAAQARLRKLAPSQIASCSIVRAELMFGARKSRRAADQYGILRATLEGAGSPIGANDLLIASIALAHDCLLVTRNQSEFARVVGQRLELWPARG